MRQALLDTSFYSAMMKRHDGAVRLVRSATGIALNPVILGELRYGFANGNLREQNERILSEFLDEPYVTLLPIDNVTSEFYALISSTLRKVGKPIPTNDIWIAASAMQHGCDLLTLDGHFEHISNLLVKLVSP
nr:ribonuclease VapC4 [uncultured bacterium]